MARPRRSFKPGTSYHVTMRCNNQAFDLRRPQSRKAILFCLARARGKFDFALFGVCVMSNHVHYMIRPERPDDMPPLMHWLNWYSAMLLNRLLRRRGHFWERRYHATAVPDRDLRHALRLLRYIHANPRAAGMIKDYAYVRRPRIAQVAILRPDVLGQVERFADFLTTPHKAVPRQKEFAHFQAGPRVPQVFDIGVRHHVRGTKDGFRRSTMALSISRSPPA